jgi:hypothetical protein
MINQPGNQRDAHVLDHFGQFDCPIAGLVTLSGYGRYCQTCGEVLRQAMTTDNDEQTCSEIDAAIESLALEGAQGREEAERLRRVEQGRYVSRNVAESLLPRKRVRSTRCEYDQHQDCPYGECECVCHQFKSKRLATHYSPAQVRAALVASLKGGCYVGPWDETARESFIQHVITQLQGGGGK